MQPRVTDYRTLIFDCDGVVLNSNAVKTQAFYQAALPYGQTAAQALVDYHIANGGISRYKKFAYFLEQIIPPNQPGPDLTTLLDRFAQHVHQELLTCDIAQGLPQLRQHTANARWLIVSGGDQSELRQIFAQRHLATQFDGGIFGSPDEKSTIVERELNQGTIQHPALFLGDSRLDHQVAAEWGLDFVFVSQWTELKDWAHYCATHRLPVIDQISDLLNPNVILGH
jgi:phosphoglycolate phosphatase-like HAD superfamily hydrolase